MNSSQRIKARRTELGLSQRAVAEACGISQPAYAKIENGGNTSHWVVLAKALKTTAEWLQFGQGPMQPTKHIDAVTDIFDNRRDRLRQLIDWKFEGKQTLLAEALDRQPSYFSRVLSTPEDPNHKRLGEELAREIEQKLDLPAGWLDTRATKIQSAEPPPGAFDGGPQPASEEVYALIPQYSTKGSCGTGYYNDHVEVNGGMAFKRDWLARRGVDEMSACVIYAHGDSMMPTIGDGDVLLLDQRDTALSNGGVYAVMVDDELLVKRVQRSFGMLTLKSDNPDKITYHDIMVPANVELHVVGKVVWRGGNGGL